MTAYRERRYRSAEGLSLYYRDYDGPAGAIRTPVLCIPGLTRNARDFEAVAAHVARTRRVLVSDLRGRGQSDYDPDPGRYVVPVEAQDMIALLADAGLTRVIVLGTSRGGIVAMAMAGAKRDALAGAILNDIGAVIEARGLQRIVDAVATPLAFANWDEAAAALKDAYRPDFFGVSDTQWLAFARAVFKKSEGRIVPDRDPRLLEALLTPKAGNERPPVGRLDLWPLFGALANVPVLLIRGANSDLLSGETVERMREKKPDLVVVTVKDRGHVPFLDEDEAVAAIDRFLDEVG